MKKTLAFIMAILTTFTALSFGACNGAGTSDTSTGKEQVEQSSGFEVNAGQESGISFLTTTIAESDYEAYGVSAQAESALTITATVTPEYATNIALDWSVAFADPASEWATGKTVTDFVTVSPIEDGANTAVVTNYGAFGEQIIITVTSRENGAISASCTADYAEKIDKYQYVGLTAGSYVNTENPDEEYHTFWEVGKNYGVQFSKDSTAYRISFVSSNYTVADTFTYAVEVKMNDALVSAFSAELEKIAGNFDVSVLQRYTEVTWGGFWFANFGTVAEIQKYFEAYENVLRTLGAGAEIGTVRVTATGEYSTHTEEFAILIHDLSVTVAVENVSLSDTNLTF